MAINKVVYGTTVLVDLTGDTVTAADLAAGKTAHGKDGEAITGTLQTQTYYTGTTEPAATLGSDGDLYFLTEG